MVTSGKSPGVILQINATSGVFESALRAKYDALIGRVMRLSIISSAGVSLLRCDDVSDSFLHFINQFSINPTMTWEAYL